MSMTASSDAKNDTILEQILGLIDKATGILEAKGAGLLSWRAFLNEFEEHHSEESSQSFQELCCNFVFPGLLCTVDFIAVDTPRNAGLLKLGLIIAVNDKLTGGNIKKARLTFFASATEEERDQFGRTKDALSESISSLPDHFELLSGKVSLRHCSPIKYDSFFIHENHPQTSAVHKLRYFLCICNGSSGLEAAFRFCCGILLKQEKATLSVGTKEGFVQSLKSMDAFVVETDTVSIPGARPSMAGKDIPDISETQGQAEGLETVSLLQELEITRARVILGDCPLTWEVFLKKLASSQSEDSATFQDRFFQTAPSGFLYSSDFISTDTAHNLGLIKLQLVTVIDNKLGNGQLGKMSYHFNVVSSEDERKLYGKNFQALSQSLLKHPDLFCLPRTGSDKCRVSPAALTMSFDSFFQLEGKARTSMVHKLKYFLNLSGGSCNTSTIYEFARNLLAKEEKDVFRNRQDLLLEAITQEGGTFQVIKETVSLRSRYLWSKELRGYSTETGMPTGNKQPTGKQQVQREGLKWQSYTDDISEEGVWEVKVPSQPAGIPKEEDPKHHPLLTEHSVLDHLKSYKYRYPMTWTEFKTRFLSRGAHTNTTIAEFQQKWQNRVSKLLIISPDYIAMNNGYQRSNLKLQLILETRERSDVSSNITVTELEKQFREISTKEETVQSNAGCQDFNEYLSKFPRVFSTKGETVSQGGNALKFESFFAKEGQDPTSSVLQKLDYFENLCGGHCSKQLSLKFLQRHILPVQEKVLVNSVEKAMYLIVNSCNGFVTLPKERKITQKTIPKKTETATKSQAVQVKEQTAGTEKMMKGKEHPTPLKVQKETAMKGQAVVQEQTTGIKKMPKEKEHPGNLKELKETATKSQAVVKEQTAGIGMVLKEKELPVPLNEMKETENKSRIMANQQTAEIEKLLQQKEHPISWKVLRSLRPGSHSSRSWKNCLKDLRAHYLEASNDQPFIQGVEYITLNTNFDRGYLKLCLLVRLNMNRRNKCLIQELSGQFKDIGSGVERQQYQGDLEFHLQKFPLVFEQWEENYVIPGPEMFAFSEFFSCRKHEKADCLSCFFLEFMNICGGKCHYNKAYHFMTLMASLRENQRELQAGEFDKLLDGCKDVNSDKQKLLTTTASYRTGFREHMPTRMESSSSSSTELHSPTAVLPLSESGRPYQMNVQQKPKRTISVQVIDSDETLDRLIAALQAHSRPIISVDCSKDALVVVDWFGVGFILPVNDDGLQASGNDVSARWSSLWGLFQNENLVSVMFDCEAVGRFLLEKLDLQLLTVFDVKAAVGLINSTSTTKDTMPLATVSELCQSLEVPAPDQIDHLVIGEMTTPQVQMSKMIQEAGALVPGVYSRLFQLLEGIGVLGQLHTLTNSKLQSLYMTKMNGFLPKEIKDVLSGKTLKDRNTTTVASPDTSSAISADKKTNPPDQLLNGNISYWNSPANASGSPELRTHIGSSFGQVYSASSDSLHSLSSGSSVSHSQNITNQPSDAVVTFGSILPADTESISHPSESLTNSFRNTLQTSPFGQPSQTASYASDSVQSVMSISSIPVSPNGRRQFSGSTSSTKSSSFDRSSPMAGWPSVPAQSVSSNPCMPVTRQGERCLSGSLGAQKAPSFSQPSWMMDSSRTSSSDDSCHGSPVDIQSAKNDWFSDDMEDDSLTEADELVVKEETRGFGMDMHTKAVTASKTNVSGLTEGLIRQYTEKNKESIVLLLNLLGEDIKTAFSDYVQQQQQDGKQILTEITLDVGRHAEARFHKSNRNEKQVVVPVSSKPITNKDLELIGENEALTGFDDQNRCGIEGTLHSVRCLRNRKKKLIGLTIQIGLSMLGCADMMYDIAQSGKSTLILGYPGVGKTTLLRELARCLSDNEKKKVVVIDTCNEIAGDCDVPHFSIGSARRLQVPEHQHTVLLESARNHSPEVIIIDQIESREDVSAVTRLSKSGIQIIAGTSRDSVQGLVNDDNLAQIFQVSTGGLDDLQSLDSAGTFASARFNPPFQTLVEMCETTWWHVHDLEHTFRQLSTGQAYTVQERLRIDGGDKNIVLREKVIHPTM